MRSRGAFHVDVDVDVDVDGHTVWQPRSLAPRQSASVFAAVIMQSSARQGHEASPAPALPEPEHAAATSPPQSDRVADLALEAIAEGVIGYRQIVGRCTAALGRPLLKPEKTAITQAIHGRHDDAVPATGGRVTGNESSSHVAEQPKVLLFTGFSLNYTVGHLCAAVNRAYAARHGYLLCTKLVYNSLSLSLYICVCVCVCVCVCINK